MSAEPKICPDDLIAKERSVPLSELELHRLDAHCARCETCRVARQIGADFDRILVEPVESEAVDRVVSGAVANIWSAPFLAPVRQRNQQRRFRVALVAAVSVGFISASAAAWFAGVRIPLPFIAQETAITAPTITPRSKRVKSAPARPHATEAPAETIEASGAGTPTSTDVWKARPNATDLFTRANRARRDGQYSRAVALYSELQRKYPTSPEARLSHVSMGRLLLNRLREPQMALEQFQQYLSQSTQGSLSEEALFGQSMALMRLGRRSAEADSWVEILDRFPGSAYEKIARERISKLR
jgi:TolA-binding protein